MAGERELVRNVRRAAANYNAYCGTAGREAMRLYRLYCEAVNATVDFGLSTDLLPLGSRMELPLEDVKNTLLPVSTTAAFWLRVEPDPPPPPPPPPEPDPPPVEG